MVGSLDFDLSLDDFDLSLDDFLLLESLLLGGSEGYLSGPFIDPLGGVGGFGVG